MPSTLPNKYTTLSPNINTGSFDHWSLPVLEALAGCNYSETCQMLLQIGSMSCLSAKLLFWWASVNTTPLLKYWLRLLSFRNMPPSPQLSLIGSTLILCYCCHRECYLLLMRGDREKITAWDIYLMFSPECSSRGRGGPSASREDRASEAGTSSAVAAHPGCSLWQGLREVRRFISVIRWRKWCVVQLKLD